ncbi:FlgB family protein [Rubrimonas cliftonensis]|uniref:Flagellar basal-body rod protein FlgB n=1 Tax=Rubrimonas cliftonensis TaxID=89524 RepID=A0A1H4F3P4_9RHOB|nr:FlgB family protein [Rubrimonas cliftonensis]SEA91527.1 flagellar basal-body rod protein FlgB [Rubrimonas cliftonensis]
MNDIAILKMADAMARHAAGRHALVARNIANADTPGYAAQDLKPFEAVVREREALRSTRPSHLAGGATVRLDPHMETAPDAASPNGNTVSLPDQVARGSQAMGAHDRALAIYGKTMDILRAGLGRR